MADRGNGFIPIRSLTGSNIFHTQKFPVDDSNVTPLYTGSPCALSSGKVVHASADNATQAYLGIVKATYRGTGKNRPNTHRLPDNGNFLEASQAGWVEVYTDPFIVYKAEVDSALSLGAIGQVGDFVLTGAAAASGGNNNTGISVAQLDGSTFAAQTTANAYTLPFLCLGIAHDEKVANTSGNGYNFGTGSSGAAVEVVINHHAFRPQQIVGAA